ncbi:ORF6N domain-containing protein [Limibacterium fermenti]|uniref:ORF6N domain-containing protein n=1 Tax=Limibacterium fermenti TaxID=3229863 RepID=UPI003A6BEDD2
MPDQSLLLIQSKIYEIRNEPVMIDRDLAEMYGIETRVLNQAVKRNIDRFPPDFMFRLTGEEFQNWKSQIVMSNTVNMGLRRPPYAFTELGVAMLSSVLNSPTAVQINIGIMRAFVYVRKVISNHPSGKVSELQQEVKNLKEYVEEVFSDYNDINEDTRMQLELINQSLAGLQAANKAGSPRPRKPIGYITNEGQINNDTKK